MTLEIQILACDRHKNAFVFHIKRHVLYRVVYMCVVLKWSME